MGRLTQGIERTRATSLRISEDWTTSEGRVPSTGWCFVMSASVSLLTSQLQLSQKGTHCSRKILPPSSSVHPDSPSSKRLPPVLTDRKSVV